MHGKLCLPFSYKIRKENNFFKCWNCSESHSCSRLWDRILVSLLKLPDTNIRTAMLGSHHKFNCAGISDQQMSRDIKPLQTCCETSSEHPSCLQSSVAFAESEVVFRKKYFLPKISPVVFRTQLNNLWQWWWLSYASGEEISIFISTVFAGIDFEGCV